MRILLTGDVMTGRGIDRILPDPAPPDIFEPVARSAHDYVALAERRAGPLPRAVPLAYPWGDLPAEATARRPDLRLANLETAVTGGGTPAPKGINYRMSPANAGTLAAAALDLCVLANNHVLDWGAEGLADTLAALAARGVGVVGAGPSGSAAAAPHVLSAGGAGRLIVLAYASMTSGVPADWAAGPETPGVNLLPAPPEELVADVRSRARHAGRRAGDRLLVSIHWGGNWGYEVPDWQRELAHRLIEEADVDAVHGHSAHHPKAIEVHRGRLVLYGCGDLLNDYEGIGGHEAYRPDLSLAYFADLAADGALQALEMVPFRIHRFRLSRARGADAAAVAERVYRETRRFGSAVDCDADDVLRLRLS